MPSRTREPELSIFPLTNRFSGSPAELVILNVADDPPQLPEGFLEPHRKDYHLIVFVRKGNGRHWVDMKPYNLKAGAVYFTTPDQVHVKEETQPVDGFALAFTREFLSLQPAPFRQLPVIDNPARAHELLPDAGEQKKIISIFRRLHEEFRLPGEWQREMIFAHLQELLIFLSRIYSRMYQDIPPDKNREMLADFECEIETHFRTQHQVSDYARDFHLSVNHFTELIKLQSGKTPIEHIHERLVMESKRQLFHTRQTIKEIAFLLGFQDASYFNRFFKRLTGCTPLEYRKQTGEKYHTNRQD